MEDKEFEKVYFYDHLKSSSLEDRELFLHATKDIEDSFTGRWDILSAGLHIFFLEASKLIRNSIKLYEDGFFDAAFYSVRSSLELARIVTYFSEESGVKDSEIYKNWISGGRFPFDSKIRNQLEETSDIYQEVYKALHYFFDEQEKRLKLSQKYIHKQGYKSFHERGLTNTEKENQRREVIFKDFYQFIKNSLAEIALLRLCIDPFPLLLRDQEVAHKIHFEIITDPFSDDFVNHILGEEKAELYRTTAIYKSHYDHFKNNRELSDEAYELINNCFYDRKKWPVIKKQIDLLPEDCSLVVRVFNTSTKIANIYLHGGFSFYFSNISSSRKQKGFNSESLLKVKESNKEINHDYDEAHLSYFSSDKKELWLEHNKPLSKSEVSYIKSII